MIAIHKGKGGFHPFWRSYCDENGIAYKEVDCYSTSIIQDLNCCEMLFWHFSQSDPKDILISKAILNSLHHAGLRVFPDYNSAWHFDDKVAQKYLLEALKIPHVPSYVFVRKSDALSWIKSTHFPKVFKLKGGAGSANVQLVQSAIEAKKLIMKAFGSGFKPFDGWGNFKDAFKKYRKGKQSLQGLLKAFYRALMPPEFVKAMGNEYGYVYFQDFIPDNDSDLRVIVTGNKAFAIKRKVRENDFRASGSGYIEYEKELFDNKLISHAFDIAKKLNSQCIALDFVKNEQSTYLLVEISYGFAPHGYVKCEGYWDEKLDWHRGEINPYGWMIDLAFN